MISNEGIVKNDVCALKDIGSEMRNIPVNMDESEAVIEFLINTQHEQTAILTCKGQKGKMTIIEISSQPSLRDESVEEDASLIVICNKGQWFSEDGLKVMNINCYHINSYLEQFE
ncbi:unnamed protein product [Auanema sp. JU1783]|nr:unnamed protein product [Auanema sp. JU1783]